MDTISSRNDEKSDEANKNNVEITLYYWALKNRGNSVRLPLVEAGMKYKEENNEKLIFDKCHCYASKEKLEQVNEAMECYDPFVLPYIDINGEIYLSQTVAIQQYIGQITGLSPISALDNSLSIMILENCNDIMSESYVYLH